MASRQKKAPWKRSAPKRTKRKSLSSSQKRSAKSAAKRAGRPYPNLVDNMRAASKGRKTGRKKTSRKKTARKKTSRARSRS